MSSTKHTPSFNDPLGSTVTDFNRKETMINVALGTGTPNTNALYNVANGGAFGIGCILKNTTGRSGNVLFIYTPLNAAGSDPGSGSRWTVLV